MDTEIDEDKRANLRESEHHGSQGTVEANPDVCESPPEAGGEVPVPYPETDKAKETAGVEKMETEGKPVETKSEIEKSSGDEAGAGEAGSGVGFLKEILRGELLGVPLWIWVGAVIALLVVAWILSANTIQPFEPLE